MSRNRPASPLFAIRINSLKRSFRTVFGHCSSIFAISETADHGWRNSACQAKLGDKLVHLCNHLQIDEDEVRRPGNADVWLIELVHLCNHGRCIPGPTIALVLLDPVLCHRFGISLPIALPIQGISLPPCLLCGSLVLPVMLVLLQFFPLPGIFSSALTERVSAVLLPFHRGVPIKLLTAAQTDRSHDDHPPIVSGSTRACPVGSGIDESMEE